ncbi:MAG TPA: DciA family protein [Ornithinicoccus sp.]|nr:DciA family protein [Ornithinicoccus sp.]
MSTDDEHPHGTAAGEAPGAAGRPEAAGGAGAASGLQAAAEALSRARANARARGLRPGTTDRRRRSGDTLGQRRSGTGDGAARDPRLVGAEVERLVSSRGWDSDVQVGAVIGRWPTIVGAEVAQHVKPLGFDETVLTVQADSTAWATQMRLLTHSVLTRIEAEVGAGVVTDITVRGPAAPSWRKGRLRAQGPGPRDTYG